MPTPDWNATPPDELLRRVKARGRHLRTRRQVSILAIVVAMIGLTGSAVAVASRAPSPTSLLAGEGEPDGSESGNPEEGAPATTTSTTAEGGTASGGADAEDPRSSTSTTSTTIAGRNPSTTTTTTSPATATAGDAGVAYPHPREGSYRYRVTRSDGSENETRTTFEVLSRRDTEVRLRRSGSGPVPDGIVENEIELSWQADRVLAVNDDSCDEAPMENARTAYRFPMSIGTTWSWDTTCSNDDMGKVRSRGSARVTGEATDTVGTRTVDVWVIEWAYTVSVTLHGVTQTSYGDFTEHFAADHGLSTWTEGSVRQTEARTTGDGPPVTTMLLDLDPV